MIRYYCSADGVWRRTPCVHEGCRRKNYEPEIIRDVREAMKELRERDRYGPYGR